MKIRLTDQHLSKLADIGMAFDIGHMARVHDGGRVEILETPEKERVNEQQQRARGSSAESRQRTEGPRRTPGEPGAVWSNGSCEWARLDEVRLAYPTQIIPAAFGLWTVVKSKPLGHDGPQATFVVSVPTFPHPIIKSWAFWRTGEFPKAIGPRHTNFPDHSVCAYAAEDKTWLPHFGLLPLVDLYSTWVVRQLYFNAFGRWPGDQIGMSALYRRTEFLDEEWCGCGSGERYGRCHGPADRAMSTEDANAEHLKIFKMPYQRRKVPVDVLRFVRSDFKKPPEVRMG